MSNKFYLDEITFEKSITKWGDTEKTKAYFVMHRQIKLISFDEQETRTILEFQFTEDSDWSSTFFSNMPIGHTENGFRVPFESIHNESSPWLKVTESKDEAEAILHSLNSTGAKNSNVPAEEITVSWTEDENGPNIPCAFNLIEGVRVYRIEIEFIKRDILIYITSKYRDVLYSYMDLSIDDAGPATSQKGEPFEILSMRKFLQEHNGSHPYFGVSKYLDGFAGNVPFSKSK